MAPQLQPLSRPKPASAKPPSAQRLAPGGFVALLRSALLAAVLALLALGCTEVAPDGQRGQNGQPGQDSQQTEPDTFGLAPNPAAGIDAAAVTTVATQPPTSPSETTADVRVTQIPGDRAEVGISALRDGINAALLPEPLVSPQDIRSGGPPPDGIPSIDAPEFERVDAAQWLQPQEAVVVLTLGGDARAYPTQVLIWHEIVNDTVGGEPVTIAYCPLCNTAIGYYRQLGDRILDFGTSGLLYNSALVMYDRQTESLWAHYTGQAIAGALTGAELELIPVATVAWETFVAEHPDGLVLKRPSGFRRNYYGTNPYVGYDSPNGRPLFGVTDLDPQLPPMTRVLVIRRSDEVVALAHEALRSEGVIEVDVGGGTVVAFNLAGTASPLETDQVAFGRDVGATGVFNPTVDGRRLSFVRKPDATSSDGSGGFLDNQTGSTWSVLGRALNGPLAGTQLEAIEHLDTFWFAAAAYDPGIELLTDP